MAAEYRESLEFERQTAEEERKAKFFEEHNAYLQSPEWRARRKLVLTRANGICEGCLVNKATQAHHLTYENWKEEFLWQLKAVCESCHKRFHEAKEAARLERLGTRA